MVVAEVLAQLDQLVEQDGARVWDYQVLVDLQPGLPLAPLATVEPDHDRRLVYLRGG